MSKMGEVTCQNDGYEGPSYTLKTLSESFDSFEPKCVTTQTKRLIFQTFLSHFVRVLTHYGSNESNDSPGFFCVPSVVL